MSNLCNVVESSEVKFGAKAISYTQDVQSSWSPAALFFGQSPPGIVMRSFPPILVPENVPSLQPEIGPVEP